MNELNYVSFDIAKELNEIGFYYALGSGIIAKMKDGDVKVFNKGEVVGNEILSEHYYTYTADELFKILPTSFEIGKYDTEDFRFCSIDFYKDEFSEHKPKIMASNVYERKTCSTKVVKQYTLCHEATLANLFAKVIIEIEKKKGLHESFVEKYIVTK